MKLFFGKVYQIFVRNQKGKIAGLMMMILFGTIFELLGVSAILPFIYAITSPETLQNKWYIQMLSSFVDISSTEKLILVLSVGLIAIYVVKNIYLCIMSYYQYHFTYTSQVNMSQNLLQFYIHQPYQYHLSHNSAELMRNINEDTKNCHELLLAIMQLLTELAVCVVLVCFLFITDVSITTGIAILLGGYVLLFFVLLKRYMKKLGMKERKQLKEQNRWILQSLGGIKETKILRRESFFLTHFKLETDQLASIKTKYNTISYSAKPIVETVCICGLLLIIALKISTGVDAQYFVPIIAVFAIAAFRLLPSINRITSYLSMIMFRKASLDSMYEDLINTQKIVKESDSAAHQAEQPKADFNNQIEIQQVSFHYDGSAEEVLDQVELLIPRNKSVAFIGASGGGKTTLADMILGILKPTSGQILADGKDIHAIDSNWNTILGYVPQTIYLLDDTIKKNIAYGIPNDEIDEERLKRAIREAQIEDFISSLPDGIETEVGERGVRLSGGQRQRIGIARALYNNPEVLILDEATSALDNETEKAIMDAIDSLNGKKTLIIIAHRLTTIKNCDIVYRIEDKKAIQQK